jgi:hypothetical protein
MKAASAALAALVLFSLAAHAGDPSPAPEVAACVQRDLPEPDSMRAARIISRDRAGEKKSTLIEMYGRRTYDGRRQLRIQFLQPEDVRGAAILVLEDERASEVYFASPALGKTSRITGGGLAARLFGTDLSYEDLLYLEGFTQPGSWKLREDDSIGGRPAHVVEIQPERSAYVRIVSFVDKESCLPLNLRFYAEQNFVTKELTVDGNSIRKVGSAWLPHSVLIRDRRNSSTTHVFVDRSEQDPLPEGMFRVEALLTEPR